MQSLIIGVWQGVCRDGDLAANLERTHQVIDETGDAGCDFLCMPEQFLSGYGHPEYLRSTAIRLDDPRLLDLAAHAQQRNVVTLVGLSENCGDSCGNTQVVLDGGRVAGHYRKTMLIAGDRQVMHFDDDDLPVFDARGVRFGIQICHDSSFPEIAATMAWKGAAILFSPHFNAIRRDRMDSHRVQVRNNHIGTAAHYGLIVARSNVVGTWPEHDRLGYGDSAIFGPDGVPLAEAGLFTERLIHADVAPLLNRPAWRRRTELRPAIIRQLADAALAALEGQAAGRQDKN